VDIAHLHNGGSAGVFVLCRMLHWMMRIPRQLSGGDGVGIGVRYASSTDKRSVS